MSRMRRLIGGASVAYSHQAAIILVGLWLTPFLLRHLGQQQLGLWLVVGQILGYLALTDLGVIAILPRELAFASGQGDDRAARLIASLIARVRAIVRWQTLGLGAVCLLVWSLLPTQWAGLHWPLALVFFVFVALYPCRVDVAALQGAQEHRYLATSQMVGWVAGTAVTIALVVAGVGLYALVFGWATTLAVPALAARARVRSQRQHEKPEDLQPVRQFFRRSLWISVGQIAQVLLTGTDVLVLGRILGASAVVSYSCTGKLVTVFANHPQLLMHAAQPALSELRGSPNRDRLPTVATALAQAMLVMSGALAVVILPINRVFVEWWVGPEQYGGWWLSTAFVVMMLVRHWNLSAVFTLYCFGYERQIALTELADGTVSVIGAAVLVWLWGPIGAPIGSILGMVTVSLPRNLVSVAHELNLTAPQFIKSMTPLLARITGIAVLATAMTYVAGSNSVVGALLVTASMALLYAGAVLPLVWNGPVGPYVRMAFAVRA